MTELTLGIAAVLGGLGTLFGWLRYQTATKTVNELAAEFQSTIPQFEERLRQETEQKQELEQKLKQETEARQKAERLCLVHINANERFEKQTRDAWDRYRAASLGAGNAQAWLFRELERAIGELNEYRDREKKPRVQVDPGLMRVMGDFRTEHVTGSLGAPMPGGPASSDTESAATEAGVSIYERRHAPIDSSEFK